MATQLTHLFTADEFLDAYGNREDRVEYRDGQMFQMEAVTPNHGIITANLARFLGNQLGNSPCVLYSTPFVRTKDLGYQPDLAVGCEKAEFFKDALLNPTLIISELGDRFNPNKLAGASQLEFVTPCDSSQLNRKKHSFSLRGETP